MALRSTVVTAAFLLLASTGAFAQAVRVVVVFNGDPDPAIVGGELVRVQDNTVIANLPAAAAAHLRTNPAIADVHEDAIASIPDTVHAEGKPSGGGSSSQPPQSTPWGIARIGATSAWAATRGAGVRVAVIDTGIQIGHPDLQGGAVYGANFVAAKAPDDDNGHGTHVAGTIGARDNAIGVVGVAPLCTTVAVKVLDRRGSGYYSNIVAGINWAVANNCQVINMSLGGTTNDASLGAAVANAAAAGLAVCCAAGNDGPGGPASYPGAYPQSIAVAAVDIYGNVASFSTSGAYVDIAGPGVNVTSTTKGSTYATWSGTSMATPHVAGTAALIIAAGLGDVRNRLLSTADDLNAATLPGWDPYIGNGLVDAVGATTP